MDKNKIDEYVKQLNDIYGSVNSNQVYAARIIGCCEGIAEKEGEYRLLDKVTEYIVDGQYIQTYLMTECQKLTFYNQKSLGGIILALKGVETGEDCYYWRDSYGYFSTLSPFALDTLVKDLISMLRENS